MKLKLNLVNPESRSITDIKYSISKFPDGQQSINIDQAIHENDVELSSRLSNFKDLELIICMNMALRNLGVRKLTLCTLLLGARSDRKFTEGGINYLKSYMSYYKLSESVTILDAHSDVIEACIKNYKKLIMSSWLNLH
jgi:phosphoribosylpyrophosphate synthetase